MLSKKILYIHQYFKTPSEPGGTRSYWISQKLIEKGHEVIMLTSRNNMDKFKEEISIDGISVIYLNVRYDQEMGLFDRLISFASFMIKTIKIIFKLRKKYDKIYATSTPLTVGIPAIVAKIFLKKPYIFEVRDLWPEVPIQMGAINNSLLIKLLKQLEKTIYNYADSIVALSPGMLDGVLSTGINPNKVRMIPNMAKPNEFYPREKSKSVMDKFQIQNSQITIIYFGAIGKSNGLIEFVKLFNSLKDSNFKLIIAGEGSEKANILKYVIDNSILNVDIIGNYPMNIISELVNCCDISLVCFADIPILNTNSPNKLFDSLSAGKPIIVNSAGWTRKLVEENNCGFYYDPKVPKSFLLMMEQIKSSTSVLKKMSVNSRKLSITTFDKNLLTEQIVELI